MTQEELNEVLKQHKLWLNSSKSMGKRADLSYMDLSGADLSGADLRYADLTGVNLKGANLRGADLRYADLTDADLRGADLGFANLEGADLEGANLEGTGIYFFEGRRNNVIYNSKDDKLFIGCQVHSLQHWLENYVAIGKKHWYTDEEIEKYGQWIKSLNNQSSK